MVDPYRLQRLTSKLAPGEPKWLDVRQFQRKQVQPLVRCTALAVHAPPATAGGSGGKGMPEKRFGRGHHKLQHSNCLTGIGTSNSSVAARSEPVESPELSLPSCTPPSDAHVCEATHLRPPRPCLNRPADLASMWSRSGTFLLWLEGPIMASPGALRAACALGVVWNVVPPKVTATAVEVGHGAGSHECDVTFNSPSSQESSMLPTYPGAAETHSGAALVPDSMTAAGVTILRVSGAVGWQGGRPGGRVAGRSIIGRSSGRAIARSIGGSAGRWGCRSGRAAGRPVGSGKAVGRAAGRSARRQGAPSAEFHAHKLDSGVDRVWPKLGKVSAEMGENRPNPTLSLPKSARRSIGQSVGRPGTQAVGRSALH